MKLDRIMVIAYNAISEFEEWSNYPHDDVLDALGIDDSEYSEIMGGEDECGAFEKRVFDDYDEYQWFMSVNEKSINVLSITQKDDKIAVKYTWR